jgi:hypothetical protein
MKKMEEYLSASLSLSFSLCVSLSATYALLFFFLSFFIIYRGEKKALSSFPRALSQTAL